ncbi:MAG: hypothetical protein AUG85_07420 [Gemmatimonadetes bacterium 13_1_20CM_4_66_11]|nr:MAG: hypothetical protein AUG85_07420 [Gemmatimonadetes bacterium 13_1_20CM_4_66_11]
MGTRGEFKVAITKEDLVFAAAHFITFAGHTAELDHRVLLPRDNPQLKISEENGSLRVAFAGQPRYVFPAGDCVILPIPNTTVEMLAQYLAARVRAELGAFHLKTIEVEVEENFGQSASYRETLD